MKTLFTLSLFLISSLFACKESKSKYYIVIERVYNNTITGKKELEHKIDSAMFENDSLAYVDGVFSCAANFSTEKKFKEKGIFMFQTHDFDVLDENKQSIKWKISPTQKDWGNEFIQSRR